MPTKKKKARKATRNPHSAQAKPKRSSSTKHRRNPSVPAGMVLVPASMVGPVATAAKKKRKSHRRGHPQKHNPENPMGEHVSNALHAVGFGALAALLGIGGGYALCKLNLKSKGANIAANVAVGTLAGSAVGIFNPTAGTLLAHNYFVAAGQWAFMPDRSRTSEAQSQQTRNVRSLLQTSNVGASPRMMQAAKRTVPQAMQGTDEDVQAVHGDADDVGDFEPIQAISADTFGDADDVGDFEPLQAISADMFGDADDVGDLDGISADMFGDADDVGDPFGDPDDVADPFGDIDD